MLLLEAALNEPNLAGGLLNREIRQRAGPLPYRRGEGPGGSLSHDLTDTRSQGEWPRHIRP